MLKTHVVPNICVKTKKKEISRAFDEQKVQKNNIYLK